MIRALLLILVLAPIADAQLLGRRNSTQQTWRPQSPLAPVREPDTRPVQTSRIIGHVDELPQEPEFYTVVVFPEGYSRSQRCQELIQALSTDPTLVALRQATCLQPYSVADPDFRWRFKPQETLQRVLAGGTAMMVVDRDGGLVWWLQGGTASQYAADIQRQGVLDKITLSEGGIFGRIRRPKVCTPETCPPPGTPSTPGPSQPGEPLRPILPPINTPQPAEPGPGDPIPPVSPTDPAPPSPPAPDQAAKLQQLQQAVAELKQQITINTPQQPGVTPEQLEAAKNEVLRTPFWIRVVDPRGKYTTEPQKVYLGQQLDLKLEPVDSGTK